MRIKDLNGKTICILGFGREGRATAKALKERVPKARITIADKNASAASDDPHHKLQTGPGWLQNLEAFDVIIKSPGIPPLPEFKPVAKKITNATQIFLDTIEGSGTITIGVTGSKGKSTTASLIAEILKAGGKTMHLVGNIGKPVLDSLSSAKEGTYFVVELSSYQLMDMTRSPEIAVITSVFPEHLDYHGSFEAYKEAKGNITRFQKKGDVVFYNALSPEAKVMAKLSKGKKVKFDWGEAPLRIEETKLLGMHNLNNMAAAVKVGLHAKIPKAVILNVLREFEGLPHRLQFIGNHHGIEWVDDAISTTPESTIAALEALGDRIMTIILGGQDRGNDFSELGKKLLSSKIEHIILFPESGRRIRQAVNQETNRLIFHEAATMEEAVAIANKVTPQGKICLLSTASPSYNMFRNFEEKGEKFLQCIKAM
ncbi:MAG: UDP-N-acetylmuramoyl-L-alanine--D-glutamate ligase [Patescibacteria group bacterium]